MSLNGLDDPKVKEAHDAAVAEAGGWYALRISLRPILSCARGTLPGWDHGRNPLLTTVRHPRFLLKYASRDELELLGRGTGGIAEVRNAVAQYEDTSPLYGFLRYRRRNVIIKYLPEDCSRLIQGMQVSTRPCPTEHAGALHPVIVPCSAFTTAR